MPSILVDPFSDAEELAGGPILGGVTFRRVSARTVTWEPARNTVTLAGGGERTYDAGLRRVVALSWAKMSADEVEQLRQILASPFITYADNADADPDLYGNDGLQAEAIPRTVPVKHQVSVTLRAQNPTR